MNDPGLDTGHIERRIDAIGTKVDQMSMKVDKVESQMEEVRKDLKKLRRDFLEMIAARMVTNVGTAKRPICRRCIIKAAKDICSEGAGEALSARDAAGSLVAFLSAGAFGVPEGSGC